MPVDPAETGYAFGRDAANSVSIRLTDNGSKMIGLPCAKDTIRGFTADLLILDEAAYVPDTVHMAARPMLASTDGDLAIMSTANEPVGFFEEPPRPNNGRRRERFLPISGRARRLFGFWEAMTRVVSAAVPKLQDWFRMTVRAGEVSRFSREFLEDERRSLGAAVYAREYECVFEDAGGGVFQRSIVEGRVDGRGETAVWDLIASFVETLSFVWHPSGRYLPFRAAALSAEPDLPLPFE